MITDLFSHKIHSSAIEWQDKLIELACIFSEFDGKVYDRSKIELRLQEISPRATFVARDPSKFRDEISAYPAYLGLYRLELISGFWIFRLSETAKRYLISEEPNVSAFMLLQLSLFQYPNGMGVVYYSNSGNFRIQANTRDRTFDFIKNKIHISPLRLICKGLDADSIIRNISPLQANITYKEVFILANDLRTSKKASPDISDVIKVLKEARENKIEAPKKFESRFHILNHTDFIHCSKHGISLRETISKQDEADTLKKFETLNSLVIQFNGFNNIDTVEEFELAIQDNNWGKYFDSLTTLSGETIEILAHDIFEEVVSPSPMQQAIRKTIAVKIPLTYPFKERSETITSTEALERKSKFADPEVTRIKRQRSNLTHKLILQQLDEYLRAIGAKPFENEHIDLFAKIPNDGSFIFEIKSTTPENLLSQTRKGLSQLYEYRFRYQTEIGYDVKLCLVFPDKPDDISWLPDYLCNDRGIAVCWFNENGQLGYFENCENIMKPLLTA
jgi:hypothetical protein